MADVTIIEMIIWFACAMLGSFLGLGFVLLVQRLRKDDNG
jgi:hypothetical protein